ncbi:FTR1 family protein [Porticoccus sp.]|uniref:FTR1 family protein n=1 Tax=Porticoccus sp. TaxID=2024853 RepID=UPI003F699643
MFLNSVVLILQEILEAALLVSILLVLSRHLQLSARWLPVGMILGGFGALILSVNLATISEWLNYAGQEVLIASIMLFVLSLLALIGLCSTSPLPRSRHSLPYLMSLCVALALSREGAEIVIYLGGILHHQESVQPTFIGAGIGAGIGLSAGILLYFSLLSLPAGWIFCTCMLLLALIGGTMASQATLLLTQADWIGYSPVLWDSSKWLPEDSIPGHLLYALVGYEATPSLFQTVAYGLGFLFVSTAATSGRVSGFFSHRKNMGDK